MNHIRIPDWQSRGRRFDPEADHYVSPDTGSNIKGFSEVNNIEIRRFNFNGF